MIVARKWRIEAQIFHDFEVHSRSIRREIGGNMDRFSAFAVDQFLRRRLLGRHVPIPGAQLLPPIHPVCNRGVCT